MRGTIGAVLLLVCLLSLDPVPAVSGEPDASARAIAAFDTLPGGVQRQLRNAPVRYVERMAELIIGYGRAGVIDPEGIDAFIAVERARVRAYHLRRLLLGDLNGDGAVSRPELAVLQRTVSARQRGLQELAFRRADENEDAVVSAVELRAHAQRRALEALTRDDAAELRALMSMDIDASGGVTLDEVMAVVAALRTGVAAPGARTNRSGPPEGGDAI